MTERRNATWFFWFMLAAASAASIAGNVAHALSNPAAGDPAIAAGMAVGPPAVLIGATHGTALLLRVQAGGWAARAAILLTVGLAGAAFVLSFDALHELAVTQAGIRPAIAFLWPVTVDASIAVSTIALLALNGTRQRAAVPAAADQCRADIAPTAAPAEAPPPAAPTVPVSAPAVDSSHHETADELIGAGVTRVDRDRLAAVLRGLADGIPPSTVARRVGVRYQTVQRVASIAATANAT
ncbi:membrane protein [Mycobacterium phage Mendokysei]|uniref:Membrane protein n=1 Tax=Mycobacterium phage Mendokysei TaxID=2099637 RepID=A0A2P1CG98_9CAUD|nr:membrane protein [Mycobacterium phage Mendokysei]AVJ50246.1 membrane protein [Mycobacterium phage Mendokysei]